jgi:hypothetical protein
MTKRCAILGCGPSGLMVAHAAAMSGWDFRIYSKKRKSRLFGAQYLHEPIPGMTDGSAALVEYHLEGTPEEYRRKVYGDAWDGTVSPEDLAESHYAWDIRATYDKMYAAYEDEIVDCKITKEWQLPRPGGRINADIVISTVPRTIWAEPGDQFLSQKVWAIGDAPELGQETPFRPADNTVLCDGTKDVGWYRASNIFGHCTIEWPERTRPSLEGVSLVEKPLTHNSTAASDFIHLGRYGAWQKGVLTTDVFNMAMKILQEDRL